MLIQKWAQINSQFLIDYANWLLFFFLVFLKSLLLSILLSSWLLSLSLSLSSVLDWLLWRSFSSFVRRIKAHSRHPRRALAKYSVYQNTLKHAAYARNNATGACPDMSAAKEKKRIDDDGGGKLLASPVVKEKERERYIWISLQLRILTLVVNEWSRLWVREYFY